MLHNYAKDDLSDQNSDIGAVVFSPQSLRNTHSKLVESWLMVNMGSILPVASSKMCCMHCSLYGRQPPLPNIVS